MRYLVFLVEALDELSESSVRRTVAVCANPTLAAYYVDLHGGDQLMLTASGELLPKFVVTETEILSTKAACSRRGAENV